MRIFFDSRWIAPHGIGRVAREYRDRLVRDFDVIELTHGPKPSSPADWWFLARAFRRSGADLLFSPGYNGTPLVGKRQLFIIHDLIHFGEAEPQWWKKRLYYNVITRAAAARSTVMTVSHSSADELVRCWPETQGRIRVMPNGIAEAFRKACPDPRCTRRGLVLFGNGRWHKNLHGMLKAIATWQRRGGPEAGASVTIIGADGPARALAENMRVKNASFCGVLSDEEMVQLLSTSAALLFCSHIEGFGLPLLEAIACGCPVVASNIAALREVGGPGCAFVDPSSTESIIEGINLAMRIKIDEATRLSLIGSHDWSTRYDMVKLQIDHLAETLHLS